MNIGEEAGLHSTHHPAVAPKHMSLRRSYRLMGIAPRTKAVTVLGERRLEDRTQHLVQGLLYEPVQHPDLPG